MCAGKHTVLMARRMKLVDGEVRLGPVPIYALQQAVW